MIMAAIGDVRIMRSDVPRGAPRLARNLWRLCFALFITCSQSFSARDLTEVMGCPACSVTVYGVPGVRNSSRGNRSKLVARAGM